MNFLIFWTFFVGCSVFVTVFSNFVSGIQTISDGNDTRPLEGVQEELKMLQLTVAALANLITTMSQNVETLSKKEDLTSRKVDVLTNKVDSNSGKLEANAKLINSLSTKVDSTATKVSQLQLETASATEYCRLLPSNTCGECTCMDDNRRAAKYFCDCRNVPVKRDCKQYHKEGARIDGIYKVHQNNMRIIQVFCDMSSDGGGWTLIQRRVDGSEKFYRGWTTYKKGFGELQHEHWLGNTNIFTMSLQGLFPLGNEVRVEVTDWDNVMRFAKYSTFEIGSESTKFRLNIGGYSGTAGDSLSEHQGMQFSTLDSDNDNHPGVHCAIRHFGAWWYNRCHAANLNGHYDDYGRFLDDGQGIVWNEFHGASYSFKHVQMKLRRKD